MNCNNVSLSHGDGAPWLLQLESFSERFPQGWRWVRWQKWWKMKFALASTAQCAGTQQWKSPFSIGKSTNFIAKKFAFSRSFPRMTGVVFFLASPVRDRIMARVLNSHKMEKWLNISCLCTAIFLLPVSGNLKGEKGWKVAFCFVPRMKIVV